MNTSNITTSDLLAILDITRRLAEQRMLQPLLEYIASTVFEITLAERCLIVLFTADGGLDVPIARTHHGQNLSAATDQMSRSILDRVRSTLTPLLVDDAMTDVALHQARSVRSLGIRSVMCVPLISHGQAIGAIYVENRAARGQFQEENLVPLVLFSNQVVVAIESARVYEALEARIAERTRELQAVNDQLVRQADEMREQSIRDSLTGLYNRRYFAEQLPQQFEVARRYQRALALALIDIDDFKQINDLFFHTGGDRVLLVLSQLLREHMRHADTVARIGGEEFAITMPETQLPAAAEACERLRLIVEQYDWSSIGPELRVTISIGVADTSRCTSAEELSRQADTLLYAAKRNGKNRVVATDSAAT